MKWTVQRYVLREVMQTWLAVTGVLVAILVSNQLSRVLGRAASDDSGRHVLFDLIALGAIMTGMFASNKINSAGKGWLIDGNIHQMWLQFIDVAAVFLYSGIGTFIILAVLKYTIGIRVSEDVEVEGLDINLHGEVVQG